MSRNTKSFARGVNTTKRVETKEHKASMFRAGIYTDDVNGVVCGDSDIKFKAALFYDGRPQGNSFWANNDLAIFEIADKLKADFINQAHDDLYTDESLWEIRIYE